MRAAVALAGLLMLSTAGNAEQHYAGMETRGIKSLSDQQIADLRAGRGMGLALAAELNGYPGPMHAIQLKDKLELTAAQVGKLQGLFSAMKAEAIATGKLLIEQERELNEAFAKQTVTLASLEAMTQKIGATHAALRAGHLKYHVATLAILTPDQVKRYNELRGYATNAPARHHHPAGRH